jgi:hypothetical protein
MGTNIYFSALSLLFCASVSAQQVQTSPDQKLLEAAAKGDLNGLRLALASGANPNAKDETGKTALVLVNKGGLLFTTVTIEEEIRDRLLGTELLVRKGAKVDVSREEYFPFHIVANALHQGKYELAEYFVSKGGAASSINIWSLARRPRIPLAQPSAVRRKLFEKVLAKTPKVQKSNPLETAAASDDAIFFTQRLLEAGFEPNRRSVSGGTPLIEAITHKREDVVALLIKFKVDVNQQYRSYQHAYASSQKVWEGKSPLQIAQAKNLPKIVELLKKAGAE